MSKDRVPDPVEQQVSTTARLIEHFLTAEYIHQEAIKRAKENLSRAGMLGDEAQPRSGVALETFPTPPGARWEDVKIQFKDGHTVSISIGDKNGIYNYTQMGMVNRKNGNTTKQWTLLEGFASGHGTMTWQHSAAHRSNQKRREVLAKNLQKFFGIEGDPFLLTPDRKGWIARFVIRPD
jgi:hypothetical protein